MIVRNWTNDPRVYESDQYPLVVSLSEFIRVGRPKNEVWNITYRRKLSVKQLDSRTVINQTSHHSCPDIDQVKGEENSAVVTKFDHRSQDRHDRNPKSIRFTDNYRRDVS